MRQTHRRNRLVVTVTAVGLGALTTVAVAWALAAWLPHEGLVLNSGTATVHEGDVLKSLLRLDYESVCRAGMERRSWEIGSFGRWAAAAPLVELYMDGRADWVLNTWEPAAWGELTREIELFQTSEGEYRSSGAEDARGWPQKVFWCSIDAPYPGLVKGVRGGILISEVGMHIGDARVLPLRPIWGGIAVNTAVFGAAWWATLAAPGAARRRLRRRRGACIGCGYNLTAQPAPGCPECGLGRVSAGVNGA